MLIFKAFCLVYHTLAILMLHSSNENAGIVQAQQFPILVYEAVRSGPKVAAKDKRHECSERYPPQCCGPE